MIENMGSRSYLDFLRLGVPAGFGRSAGTFGERIARAHSPCTGPGHKSSARSCKSAIVAASDTSNSTTGSPSVSNSTGFSMRVMCSARLPSQSASAIGQPLSARVWMSASKARSVSPWSLTLAPISFRAAAVGSLRLTGFVGFGLAGARPLQVETQRVRLGRVQLSFSPSSVSLYEVRGRGAPNVEHRPERSVRGADLTGRVNRRNVGVRHRVAIGVVDADP